MVQMKTPRSLLPDARTLKAGLARALNGKESERVILLERKLPRMMSTFPNEIVNIRLREREEQSLFIKYEGGRNHLSFGHRGGIAYEAEVYSRLLRSYPNFRPRCLGVHSDRKTGTWLILENIARGIRVSDISVHQAIRQPYAMTEAAKWLGQFHASCEARTMDSSLSFLRRYTAGYYKGWARRTKRFAADQFPWLRRLCDGSRRWYGPLLESPETVIHGEFYSKTVLLRGQRIYILDWESTAVAAGEIDLAALTEGIRWPAKIVEQCIAEYRRARWPDGPPSDRKRNSIKSC